MPSVDAMHPDFRASNEETTYPFAPWASLVNDAGRTIREEAFVDATLHPIGRSGQLFLSSVEVDGSTVRIEISEGSLVVCSGSFDGLAPPELIELTDSYGRPAGALVCRPDYLREISAWGQGTHAFTAAQTAFAATCMFPQPDVGVRGVLLPDGTILTGKVWLIGESGVRLSIDDSVDQPRVRVDFVGDPLFRAALCDDPDDPEKRPRPIRSIRVVSEGRQFECTPDEFGSMWLAVGTHLAQKPALRVEAGDSYVLLRFLGDRAH